MDFSLLIWQSIFNCNRAQLPKDGNISKLDNTLIKPGDLVGIFSQRASKSVKRHIKIEDTKGVVKFRLDMPVGEDLAIVPPDGEVQVVVGPEPERIGKPVAIGP